MGMTRMDKNLEAQMSSTGENGHLLETIAGIGEVVADVYEVGGEAFSSIPVVGTMFQLARSANTIRDKTLAAKLRRFLEPLTETSQECRDKFKERLTQDVAETRRVGEILFLVVDRLTDLDKAMILGRLFIAFLNDQLSSSDLRRMAQAVDMSFADDLIDLINSEGEIDQSQELWLKSLVPSGLAEPVGAKMFDDMGNIYYSMTELGKSLRSAYLCVQRAC